MLRTLDIKTAKTSHKERGIEHWQDYTLAYYLLKKRWVLIYMYKGSLFLLKKKKFFFDFNINDIKKLLFFKLCGNKGEARNGEHSL